MKAKRQAARRKPQPLPIPAPIVELPLISCVLTTADRPEFLAQSVRLFQAQDYPARELIIIDDGAAVAGSFADDTRIRYLRLPAGMDAARSLRYGCEQARGSLIALWDDDSWFAKGRLTYQAAPLLTGDTDITGLTPGLLLELPRWLFWACPEDARRVQFPRGISPGTLLFRRELLERLTPASEKEQSLLEQALATDARLALLPNEGLYLTICRETRPAAFAGWSRASELPLPESDRAFYMQFSLLRRWQPGESKYPARRRKGTRPLASCIMPTAGRRSFVPHAIRRFLAQDYPDCELIVVDDGADPVDDLMPDNPAIRYFRLSGKNSVGAKRNIACGYARGEIILHWDDDDWSAPWRVSYQVEQLVNCKADVCGLDRVIFAGPGPDRSYVYTYPNEDRPWVYGGTLCYRKELWTRNGFPDNSIGEDNDFLWNGVEKKIVPLPNPAFYVGMIHGGNTSPKSTWDARWSLQPAAQVMELLDKDWEDYSALLSGTGSKVKTVQPGHSLRKPAALVALGAGIGDILRATPLIRVMHGLGYDVDVFVETDYPEVVSLIDGAPPVRRLFYRSSHWPGHRGDRTERLHGLAETVYDVALFPPWLPPDQVPVQAQRRLNVHESEWWSQGVSHAIDKLARDAGWSGAMPAPVVALGESYFDISPDTVALHPGCKPDWPWKKWHGFDELAGQLPEVAVIGMPEDLENHRTYFGRPFAWPPHVRNFVGRLNLRETAALLSQCRALVSNDSGMMHLGAAVGIPTFGIFGITSPARETLPLPNLFPISKQLPCESYCRTLPARTDCEHHLRCLKTLTPQEVVARVDSLAPRRNGHNGHASVAAVSAAPGTPFPAAWYDSSYFESGGKGGWTDGYHWHILRDDFREAAAFLESSFPEAQSFLDAGCGKGFLVRTLREAGRESWGFDHSSCAVQHAVEAARPFVQLAGADDYVFERPFDMLVACELLEHLTEQQALAFLSRARYSIQGCALALMADGRKDPSRITVRGRSWWRDLFLRAGWRQDFLHKNLEQRLQAHPLPARRNWTVYLYAP